MSIRIYSLAKQLKMLSHELLKHCQKLGFDKISALASLSDEEVDLVKSSLALSVEEVELLKASLAKQAMRDQFLRPTLKAKSIPPEKPDIVEKSDIAEKPDENQELLKAIEESNPKPMLGVYFDESAGLTDDDKLLVLDYLNALYKLHGGIALKIIKEKEYVLDPAKVREPC